MYTVSVKEHKKQSKTYSDVGVHRRWLPDEVCSVCNTQPFYTNAKILANNRNPTGYGLHAHCYTLHYTLALYILAALGTVN